MNTKYRIWDRLTRRWRVGYVDPKTLLPVFDDDSPQREPEPQEPLREITARLWLGQRMNESGAGRGITPESLRAAHDRTRGALELDVIIDFEGGAIETGFNAYDMLRADQRLKRAIGLRRIFSAANCVYFACDTKLMHPSALLWLHRPVYLDGHAPDARLEQARLRFLDLISSRLPHLSRDWLERKMDEETAFTAQEAVRLGMCDGILNPDKWVVDADPPTAPPKSRTISAPTASMSPAKRSRVPISIPPMPVACGRGLLMGSWSQLAPQPANGPMDRERERLRRDAAGRFAAHQRRVIERVRAS